MGDIKSKFDDAENKLHELKGRMEQKKDDTEAEEKTEE